MAPTRVRPPPQNPFQGRVQVSQAPQRRTSTLLNSVQQVCLVIGIGAILVILLSWAVPPPPSMGDLAAPEPLPAAARAASPRKRGGVRGAQAALNLPKPADASSTAGQPLVKHWEADSLEGHGDSDLNAEAEDSTDGIARRAKHEHLQFVSSNQKHEMEDSNRVAFGRKDDDDETEGKESSEETRDEEKQVVLLDSPDALSGADVKTDGPTEHPILNATRSQSKQTSMILPDSDEQTAPVTREHGRIETGEATKVAT